MAEMSPDSCRNAATYVHLYTCMSQAIKCRVEQQLNNMKKFAVLKQLYNYSPRVLEMFDEREDAELYVTLMKKTNKDTDAGDIQRRQQRVQKFHTGRLVPPM